MKGVADFQNGSNEIKVITISISFRTLFTSIIVKVLFKLRQQVVLKNILSYLT